VKMKMNPILAVALGVTVASISTTRAATVAYWRFEPGNLTADSSGNGHTLVNSGATSSGDVSIMAPGTGSASFDGTDIMNTLSSLDLTAASAITIEWFGKTTDTDAIVFEHSPNYNLTEGAFINIIENGGTRWVFSQLAPFSYFQETNQLGDTGWHHYAVTIDGSQAGTDRIKQYRDYQYLGAGDLQLGFFEPSPDFANQILYLGARSGGALSYTGLLDEFRISDVLLAPGDFIPEPSVVGLALLSFLGLQGIRRRTRSL